MLQLFGIGRAPPLRLAVGTAEAGERTEPRRAFVVHDVIGISARIARAAVGAGHARKAEPRAKVEQNLLEGTHVAIGLHHRLTDGIGWAIGLRDRAVEQRDAVPALEIGGIRQDQVGVVDHLGRIGIGVDDARNRVVAGGRILLREILQRVRHVHRRVPAHVGHVHEQDVDAVRVLLRRIGDDHVHHAMRGQRRVPAIGLVDALRMAVRIDQQIVGRGHEAERRPGQGRVGLHLPRLARGLDARRRRLGKGRLVAEAAWHIDGTEDDLQQVQRAAGLEAIGMGRDAPHGMHRDRAAHRLLVETAKVIRPRNIELNLLAEGDLGQFGGNPPDGGGRHAAAGGDGLRRPVGG